MEFWIVNTSQALLLLWVLFISVFFILDTVQSVQAALNLAKVLDSMTHILAELEDIQVQLALLKAETNQKLANIQEEASHKLAAAKAEAALYRTSKEEQIRSLTRRMSELAHQRQHMALHIDLYQRGILKRNPGARSTRFETAFKELREIAAKTASQINIDQPPDSTHCPAADLYTAFISHHLIYHSHNSCSKVCFLLVCIL